MLNIKPVDSTLATKSNYIHRNRRKFLIDYPCNSKSECTLISVTFPKGIYRIECWGASGADRNSTADDGGRGAYTSGEISFSSSQKLYFSIGASGDETISAAYGGGGKINKTSTPSRPGGGATDIRIENNEEFNGLKSRIMVAAGGGGSVNHGTISRAGYGGNITGSIQKLTLNANCDDPDEFAELTPSTQTSGGISPKGSCISTNGTFGKGGDVIFSYSGSGGGGYYGGAAGNRAHCIVLTGAGGSSFISGHAGCDAVAYNSTQNSIKHTGNNIHYSGHFFTFTDMKNGEQNMPVPSISSKATTVGRKGDGAVRIIVILSTSMINSCRYKRSFFQLTNLIVIIMLSK